MRIDFGGEEVYNIDNLEEYDSLLASLAKNLLDTEPFNAGQWQAKDVSGSKLHETYELQNVAIHMPIPTLPGYYLQPDLPWAEDHFQERVGGEPVNPGSTHWYWPHHGKADQERLHMKGDIYDHNYMERYWPAQLYPDARGYRYPIGDLQDVVDLLKREPGTRQAYLPVWHPEDTGATKGQRVPCSLGYHFMVRDGGLDVTYYLRSCEIYRHFTNDVYLTMRLAQWVSHRIDVPTNRLHMHIASLHGFVGDTSKIEEMLQ